MVHAFPEFKAAGAAAAAQYMRFAHRHRMEGRTARWRARTPLPGQRVTREQACNHVVSGVPGPDMDRPAHGARFFRIHPQRGELLAQLRQRI